MYHSLHVQETSLCLEEKANAFTLRDNVHMVTEKAQQIAPALAKPEMWETSQPAHGSPGKSGRAHPDSIPCPQHREQAFWQISGASSTTKCLHLSIMFPQRRVD